MSTKAKATLALTTVFTIATVYGVHYQQMSEKEAGYPSFGHSPAMRAGVFRDEERIAKKKQQDDNVLELAVQQELQRKMLEEQSLRPSEESSQ
ncbi:hypothetical protein DFQ26_008591 [Actinomortierella ambigua]|nr:hypothetical protein DFQ26_008591 [Actinomortierella ambigua]